MISKPNPSYYAITPASVRYSDKLCANAKLLYGEITALCHKEGYCWAENSYFAKLYRVENGTISEWLRQLRINGFIEIIIDRKMGNARRIFIIEGVQDKPYTSSEKSDEGHQEILNTYSENTDPLYNNTITTTMNITKKNIVTRDKSRVDKKFSKEEYLLRPNEQEFDSFYHKVEDLIREENSIRPNNPFKWLPKNGSLMRDIRMLVYGNLRGCRTIEATDKKKESLLYEIYNKMGNRLNWLNFVMCCIKYTVATTRKKAITNPFGFTYSLLFKPATITGALDDGILSKEITV